MQLKIDRGRWLRGEPNVPETPDRTMLVRPADGKMCCLGFYLEECGVQKEFLEGSISPMSYSVRQRVPAEARWLFAPWPEQASYQATSVMTVNDSKGLDDGERENMLRELFMEQGVELEFVG